MKKNEQETKPELIEEEKLEIEKEIIEVAEKDVEEIAVVHKERTAEIEKWHPKTSLGQKVKDGEIKNIDEILDNGEVILESEIVDCLLPNLEVELLMAGQSKGKFGGGARRVFKQTQKKTPEGNKPSFACIAVVGNRNGYVGIGKGKSKDTVPAREKAIRNAKLNIIKIVRGCGSWECGCKEAHSIPLKIKGKCGSAEMVLVPAPKGKGLCVEKECAKILALAGVKDIWSKTFGQTKVKSNLTSACLKALTKLTEYKASAKAMEETGYTEGGLVQNA